jgi:hypothetical protein
MTLPHPTTNVYFLPQFLPAGESILLGVLFFGIVALNAVTILKVRSRLYRNNENMT